MSTPINPNKALWEKGDFTRIAESMRESGEALVTRLGITKGLKVLDLGCGDGTTALPAARLGADVLGVDIAKNLVEAGNKRAKEQDLTNCKFQEGDASNLHELEDQRFDLVVSIFGAMFAPRPLDVAKEMVRVTRPGGRTIMGNWIPNDPTLVAQILKISSSYAPPPPEGFVSPMTWGIESNVIERFAGAGVPAEKISFARETYTFNYPSAPSEFVDSFRQYCRRSWRICSTAKTKAPARTPPPFPPPSCALLLLFERAGSGSALKPAPISTSTRPLCLAEKTDAFIEVSSLAYGVRRQPTTVTIIVFMRCLPIVLTQDGITGDFITDHRQAGELHWTGGYNLRVPRSWPERQNEEQRNAFLDQLRLWQADPSVELWFADECGVEGDPRPRRSWSARGSRPKVPYQSRLL